MNPSAIIHRKGEALFTQPGRLRCLARALKNLYAFTILVFFSMAANAQLRADFSASPVAGCAPVVVHFRDLSTGNPTQWRWELGNGTISFLQNPSATYFNPGQYSIKLVIQNGAGKDSITRLQYINIYAQPVVNFSASQTAGCFPLPVQFTDLSLAAAGSISSWEWDFGDGTSGNAQSPAHTYNAPGNYNVSLRITNSNGCFKTLTRTQYIHVNDAVHAGFSNNLPNRCSTPVIINFLNSSTGQGPLTYNWNFGDGTSSSLQNPAHTYSTSGSFTVTLIVISGSGCTDTITRNNAVNIGMLQASFNAPDTVCINSLFTFSNTSSPLPVTANWNFGDGTTSNIMNPVKKYNALGSFQVRLITSSGICTDTMIKNITVVARPGGTFSATPAVSCRVPLSVAFTSSSSNAVSFEWLFGDGTGSSQPNPVHTYTSPGNYDVSLVSTNSTGCSDTIVMQQYISIQLPVASINQLPQEGCAPLSWTFSSTTNSTEPVTGYQWDFGDGTTSALSNPTHVFSAGSYNVQLIITTAGGCTDTVIVPNGVRAGIKPVANLNVPNRDVCARTPVHFDDMSVGPVDRWLWDFGDGGTSIQMNPRHVYNDTGFFTITLIVWDRGCADTVRFIDYVHINAPIARFQTDYNCSDPLRRTFVDQSIAADEWHWNFGDGITSDLQNPLHLYSSPGVYTITLRVVNHRTGCDFTASDMIWLVDENANFIVNDTSICRNSIAVFSATAAAANIESYSWTFGDGTSASGQFVQHKYTQAGSFDVSLIIKDVRDCKDTLIKRNYIKVTGPTADFTVSDTTPCLHDAVNFMDNSLTDAVNPITSWTWNYGDGITETLNSGPFQHTYTIPGIRTITLMTTDSGGCSDTIVKARLITISNPLANFNTNDTLSCPNTAIHFNNNSTGLNLTYRWDFGDGTTGNLISPVHSYASDGIYTVTLFITDRYGCTHTASRLNFIKIVTPVADFAMSDSFGTCPPLVVNFTNNSLNAVSLNWDFGDGSYSQTNHPTHFYNTPGTFIAKLTITGPGGCMSVRSRQIIVKGPQGSFSYDTLSGCKPLLVNFVAISRDRSSFVWDFNDGSTINTADSVVSHAYTIPGDYVPKMILLDAGGCFVPVTGNDTIKVKGVTASFNPDLQTICNSGNVQFTNTSSGNDPITNYQWNFGDGGSSGMENPVHTYQANGIYYPTVKVTSLSGCLDSVRSTVPVKVVASPQGLISQTANGCSPLTVMFNASLAIADTSLMAWQWNFGNGNTSILPTPVTQLYAAGSYPVTLLVTNSSGCRDTVQTTVRSYAIPVVSAGSDNTICQGTGKTLTPSGAAVYSWSPPTGLSCTDCPNPLATPASATTYIVTGTSTEGCKNIDSVYVTVKYPFMISSSRPDTLCNGRSLRLAAAGAHSYEWSPSTGLSSTSISNPVASPNNTVTYRVIGKDELNCFRDTAYVPVTVFPVPAVDAGDDKTINVGQTIDLVPKISADVTEVSWSPTGSIFRNDYPAITVKPRETTTYTVKVSNKGGCTSTDDLTVTVICNGANVFIPNTFSPNGDGMNDIFYPRGSGVFSIKAARIFSRWGELIYEKNNFMANDVSSGWDGTFKGQKLSPDVYVYVIEVLCDNNTMMPLKGNIALLK